MCVCVCSPFTVDLSVQIGFSAADAVTGLKLVEAGVPKAQLALLAVPMVPLQILLPLIISKYTAGPRPLDIFYKAFPFRYSQTSHSRCLDWQVHMDRQFLSGQVLDFT